MNKKLRFRSGLLFCLGLLGVLVISVALNSRGVKVEIDDSDLQISCHQDSTDKTMIHITVRNKSASAILLPIPSNRNLADGRYWGGWLFEIETPTREFFQRLESRAQGTVYPHDVRRLSPGESVHLKVDYVSVSSKMDVFVLTETPTVPAGEARFTVKYHNGDGTDFDGSFMKIASGIISSKPLRIPASLLP